MPSLLINVELTEAEWLSLRRLLVEARRQRTGFPLSPDRETYESIVKKLDQVMPRTVRVRS
jgi:hypothetical protein